LVIYFKDLLFRKSASITIKVCLAFNRVNAFAEDLAKHLKMDQLDSVLRQTFKYNHEGGCTDIKIIHAPFLTPYYAGDIPNWSSLEGL
jgi:hypothetical protein